MKFRLRSFESDGVAAFLGSIIASAILMVSKLSRLEHIGSRFSASALAVGKVHELESSL